jgi:hypothetical protein
LKGGICGISYVRTILHWEGFLSIWSIAAFYPEAVNSCQVLSSPVKGQPLLALLLCLSSFTKKIYLLTEVVIIIQATSITHEQLKLEAFMLQIMVLCWHPHASSVRNFTRVSSDMYHRGRRWEWVSERDLDEWLYYVCHAIYKPTAFENRMS